MPRKKKLVVRVFVAQPDARDPAQLVLLRRHYRALELENRVPAWHRKLDWRNGILLRLHDANVPYDCVYCRQKNLMAFAPQGAWNLLTLDHVIPSSRGGSNELTNLTLSCMPCNTRKGDKMPAADAISTITTISRLLQPHE